MLAQYLHELTTFPKGRHDDQVDSTAQMLDWFKQAGSGPSTDAGIWHLYKERYGAQQAGLQTARPEPLSVMAKSSASFVHCDGATGTRSAIEMSQADAEPLLRAGRVRVDAGDFPR